MDEFEKAIEGKEEEEKNQCVLTHMVDVAKRLGASVAFHYVGTGEFLTANDETLLPLGNILVFVFRFGNELEGEKIQKLI